MTLKSERLKKLEGELNDLAQWLKLNLVPKKEIEKHKAEMQNLEEKIEEEKNRLRALKESGEVEEFIAPRRNMAKNAYAEAPTMADIDLVEESGFTDISMDAEQDTVGLTTSAVEDDDDDREEKEDRTRYDDEDDDPFSDRNRWRRGIKDPDDDEW
ncbi:MAG: hypothetical protein K0S74_668 [Chlamydiales bacterium]|jgi:hypothetical protein|nr:hypothetical protein [Chlamydiales bacterium]